MDKVCFTQYIPSNKCEIKGYDQISQDRPVQNSIQAVKPEQNTDKPSSNNNKALNWTIGIGAAATLIALGVIAGRKGHLGDSVQEFLGGAKKTIGESSSDAKPPKHLSEETSTRPPEETSTRPPEETSTGTPEESSARTPEETSVNPPEETSVNPPEEPPASTKGEPSKITLEEENSEVHIEKQEESLVPHEGSSQASDGQSELQIETHQPVNNDPPAPARTPVAEESADTSAQNINGSRSDESSSLSEQNSGDVGITPSPQSDQIPPFKPDALPPESDKPPVKPAPVEPKKNETAMDKFKRLLRDPFGRKAKAKAELERQKQEAAEIAEKERLLAIKAREERIKLYPNMGIKQLEEHYAAHENLKEREIIYKHIQKQRFALQTKMDEKYSRMSKEQLLEELEKLQAVKSCDRDYDAVVMVKQHLKQKGHVFEDDLFEGYLPLDIKPIDGGIEKSQNAYRIVGLNPAYSDAPRDVAPLPDFITPNDVLIDQYGTFTGRGAYPVFSLKYGYSKFQNPNQVWYENYPDKSWTVEHAYRQYEHRAGLSRNWHYFTNMTYNNGLSGWGRPEGSFMFTIRGDIPAEKLQKIRDYFIESGIMQSLNEVSSGETCYCGQYVEKTKILDKMIEAVLDIVNK